MMRAMIFAVALALAIPSLAQTSLEMQNEELFTQLQEVHRLSAKQMERLRAIFSRSGYIGQGNTAVARHPMSVEECKARAFHRSTSGRTIRG